MYQTLILLVFAGLEVIMMLLFYTIYKQQKTIQTVNNVASEFMEKNDKLSRELKSIQARAGSHYLKLEKFEKLFNSGIEYDAKTYIKKGRAILSDTPKHA